MTDKKNSQDLAKELFVYIPVGLYLVGKQELPKVAEKGRSFVDSQLTMAKTIGEFVVTFGSQEAERRLLAQVRKLGRRWGDSKPAATAEASESTQANQVDGSPNESGPINGVDQLSGENAKVKPSIIVDSLAIPDYDSLSASQVVQRLDALDRADLSALIEYEKQTRARSTILNRAISLSES